MPVCRRRFLAIAWAGHLKPGTLSRPQREATGDFMVDLFDSLQNPTWLHPNFVALRDSPFHSDAREAINTLFGRMGDPNGNFVRDFRGEGFHARLFEVAVFAYLEEAGFVMDRSHERPDFVASRNGVAIALEATTSNPPGGSDRDISIFQLRDISEDELRRKVRVEFPRRITSALRRKVNHRYDRLPQCQGRPLVLVIGPFFEPGAVCYTDEALVDCLYGPRTGAESSTSDDSFFAKASSEHVSAILFCNQFTVPRFFRLASSFPRAGMTVVRKGAFYRNLDEENFGIGIYEHWLGEPSVPAETWHQGVTLFANPWARTPLDPELCPHTSRLWVDAEGQLHKDVGDFHPVTSFMAVHIRDAAG
jgi:hypothetical protein